MATGLQTTSHDWQNFYVGHLTADITNASTDIFIDTIPTPTESCLVIDPDTPANSEVIFYNSKTATKVTTPANGRGYDGSTAVAHLTGTKVILAPIGDSFRYIRTLATTTPQGWTPLASAPNTVTANGNRSYTCVFNGVDYTSTLSAGMRLKTTRTVAAPTQSTSLNGTTQFWSKTAPSGMTFTNNFVVSAWVKLSSYSTGVIASRFDGTSGWQLFLNSSGQVNLFGYNGGVGNASAVNCYQSIPLNKWVHVAAQLDMATFTATPTTSYIMIDGVDVPSAVSRVGTNPTALVQAGSLQVGAGNSTAFFPGKIAQVAIYSAKVTEATILASMHQGLAGTETSLISAYSFNNSISDLNANANNLTANGSAVATNTDSPFGGQAGGTISSTLDYGIITSSSFSTNTTLVVQVPEGCTIPTSGGVSAVSYASVKAPYGMPVQRGKWSVLSAYRSQTSTTLSATTGQLTGSQLTIPVGSWKMKLQAFIQTTTGGSTFLNATVGLSTATGSFSSDLEETKAQTASVSSSASEVDSSIRTEQDYDTSTQTPVYLVAKTGAASQVVYYGQSATAPTYVEAENAYL